MKIGMIGIGRLGYPIAQAIKSKGHDVYVYDIVSKNISDLQVVDSPKMDCDITFVAVQTPHAPEYEGITRLPKTTADFDYSYLKKALEGLTGVVAVISTCLPGTYEREIKPLTKNMKYVYTPQFIAMGSEIYDYFNPEFNLIGVEDEEAADKLEEFYKTINNAPCIRTDITTAEGIKVSYNTWITAKTVIANIWGEIARKTGMEFDDIYRAWSLSAKRLISPKYMKAGMSDGGGCHPRDNIALSHLARKINLSHNIFEDLMKAREDYEEYHANIAIEESKKRKLPLILLGKAFKPGTDIEAGSAALLMANIVKEKNYPFEHYEDLDKLPKAVYFIATDHSKYDDYEFPDGSIILRP